jgi:cell division protein FtsB
MIQPTTSLNEQIKKLLEENLQYSKETFVLNKKIYKYIFWKKIYSMIKMIVVIIFIILAINYLPFILKEYVYPYQELLQKVINISKQENVLLLDGQTQEIQKLLKSEQIEEILKKIPKTK